MGAHARLGPSNHRWPHCPGSVREEAQYTDVAGEAAIDGTGSHLLLELCLQNGVRAEAYDGQIIGINDPEKPGGWMVHRDRIDRVQACLNYVYRRFGELEAAYPGDIVEVEAETRSNPGESYGRDDWWGTVDITITVRRQGVVVFTEVCDYKDGRGWVDASLRNSQLSSYLVGKVKGEVTSKDWKGRVSIVQPKTNPVIRYEDVADKQALYAEGDRLAVAAALTDDDNAPLIPGKHCQWCKANPKRGGNCNASTQQSLTGLQQMENPIIATDTGDISELAAQLAGDVTTMDNDQLAKMSELEEGFNAAFDRIRNEIQRRIEQEDQVVPGWGMRPGNSTKVFAADEDTVVKKLKSRRVKKDDIYPAKLISPAQMLKLDCLTDKQKDDLKEELITVKAGKMKLTRVAHGEEQPASEMFKDVQAEVVEQKDPVSMFADATPAPAEQYEAPSTADVSFL